MSDIVDRLRREPGTGPWFYTAMCDEAADEIEQLRADRAELLATLKEAHVCLSELTGELFEHRYIRGKGPLACCYDTTERVAEAIARHEEDR